MSSFSSEHRFPLYFLYELLMSLRRSDKVTIFFDMYSKNLFTCTFDGPAEPIILVFAWFLIIFSKASLSKLTKKI